MILIVFIIFLIIQQSTTLFIVIYINKKNSKKKDCKNDSSIEIDINNKSKENNINKDNTNTNETENISDNKAKDDNLDNNETDKNSENEDTDDNLDNNKTENISDNEDTEDNLDNSKTENISDNKAKDDKSYYNKTIAEENIQLSKFLRALRVYDLKYFSTNITIIGRQLETRYKDIYKNEPNNSLKKSWVLNLCYIENLIQESNISSDIKIIFEWKINNFKIDVVFWQELNDEIKLILLEIKSWSPNNIYWHNNWKNEEKSHPYNQVSRYHDAVLNFFNRNLKYKNKHITLESYAFLPNYAYYSTEGSRKRTTGDDYLFSETIYKKIDNDKKQLKKCSFVMSEEKYIIIDKMKQMFLHKPLN